MVQLVKALASSAVQPSSHPSMPRFDSPPTTTILRAIVVALSVFGLIGFLLLLSCNRRLKARPIDEEAGPDDDIPHTTIVIGNDSYSYQSALSPTREYVRLPKMKAWIEYYDTIEEAEEPIEEVDITDAR
ncbi:hypothetical protein EXIGLDRAFT_770669 [Exidia glandulosa HHB12029]|uniref:Uncharacterized protein n=1 Tax=Exidia glandulosa HHB12029 TaxID=1314781 RepID=A0A165GJH3_EXIGL|nr:hypothetical protein EXIGLDRAFT_770669 [Exidia glandulosa HHB12029]